MGYAKLYLVILWINLSCFMNWIGCCCEKTLGFLFYVIRVLLPPAGRRGGAAARRGGGVLRDAELSFYNTYLKPLYLYILALKNRSMFQRVNTKIWITLIYLIYFTGVYNLYISMGHFTRNRVIYSELQRTYLNLC